MVLVAQMDRAPDCDAGGCGIIPRLTPQIQGDNND
ncbi:hypothetical protein KIT04_071 [Vibrio phage KIT04]|nr:hypothetical protein KIT04_071 [Vibrio phage KIT04]